MKDRDYLSISEFSELTGIKQSTLRHYDEIKLFQPYMRGENGYRYYSALQTVTVNCISVMHSLKIPLKKISAFRKQRTPEQILDLLQQHEFELNRQLLRLQQAYSVIHTYSGLIQEGLLADEHSVSRRHMPEAYIELGQLNDFSSGSFYDSFSRFIKQMDDMKIASAYPAGGFYNDMNAFSSEPGQPDRFFFIVPTGRDKKQAGEYLVGYTRGYYGNLGHLPQRLQAYAFEHGLSFNGPVYEIYLHDELSIADHEKYLIQVSVPVKRVHD